MKRFQVFVANKFSRCSFILMYGGPEGSHMQIKNVIAN